MLRGVGNTLDQRGEGLRHAFDFFQGHPGILRQTRATHHFGGGLLHGNHRFVGVGLDRPHQRFDLPGGGGRALRQPLDFIGDHRKTAPGITGHRSLDRRVECKDVGLVSNVIDQADNVADFLRRLAQALDPLGGVLNLLANIVHAVDGVVHHLVALVGDFHRTLGHRRGLSGVRRDLIDGLGHVVDRGGGFGNLLRLMLRSLGQVHGGGLGFLHGGSDLASSEVYGRHQIAQLVHGVVDRVGDGPGEVFGHRGGHGQVAIRQVFDLVEQAHDRVLVTLILLGRFAQLTVGFTDHHQTNEDDRHQRQQAQHVAANGVGVAPAGQVFETAGQVRGFLEQGLRQGKDTGGRFTDLEQLRRGFEDFIHRTRDEFEQLGNLDQPRPRIAVFDLADFQRRIALEHAVEHLAESRCIATEGVSGLLRIFITGEHGVHGTENPLSQQRLALGHGHLRGRGTALKERFDDFFVLDLQLRHGFGQGRGDLMQRQHGLFAGEDRVGVFQQAFPVQLHGTHFRTHGGRCRRQAGGWVAVLQIAPALGKVIARIAQQLERRRLAGRRFGGVLGNALGQHAQLTCVGDVLFVVRGLGVEVREVGEQQHDEDDQRDEQRDDL